MKLQQMLTQECLEKLGKACRPDTPDSSHVRIDPKYITLAKALTRAARRSRLTIRCSRHGSFLVYTRETYLGEAYYDGVYVFQMETCYWEDTSCTRILSAITAAARKVGNRRRSTV